MIKRKNLEGWNFWRLDHALMLNYFVDDAVGKCFIRSHVEISVSVIANFVNGLIAECGQVCVEGLFGVQNQFRCNFKVCCL